MDIGIEKDGWGRGATLFLALLAAFTLLTVPAPSAVGAEGYVDNRARSPHFVGGEFKNGRESDKSYWKLLWMRLTTDYDDWPHWRESSPGPAPPARVEGDQIRVTTVNHSTVLIQTHGYNIITDPIYAESCSPVPFSGFKRVRQPGVRFYQLPKIDLVLISHDHYDHLDLPTVRRLVARDNPRIFLGLGVGRHLLDLQARVTELDWWQGAQVTDDFSLTFVPVQHFSGRTLFDTFSTLWGGFVLEIGERKIYFGGDSGYANHYKETFARFGPMDLALLPIGAYSPQSFFGYAHLDPRQAVQAHTDLHSGKSIGVHYGTFRLTAEGIDEPVKALARERERAGLPAGDFITADFGQAVVLKSMPSKASRPTITAGRHEGEESDGR